MTDEMSLEFDPVVYRLSAVKKAAYKFGNRLHIRVEIRDGGRVHANLRCKSDSDDLAYLAGEFYNEALDQELREQVADETMPIRNLLLAQAFSKTSLVDPLGDDGDWSADPKAIRNIQRPVTCASVLVNLGASRRGPVARIRSSHFGFCLSTQSIAFSRTLLASILFCPEIRPIPSFAIIFRSTHRRTIS